jgi:hypothetical protein
MIEQEHADSLPQGAEVPVPVLLQDLQLEGRRQLDPPPGTIGYLERYGILRPKE